MTNVQCNICLENYNQNDETNCTPCGHIYHSTCLLTWLSRDQTCPQCRTDCQRANCKRIYFDFDDENNFAGKSSCTLVDDLLKENALLKDNLGMVTAKSTELEMLLKIELANNVKQIEELNEKCFNRALAIQALTSNVANLKQELTDAALKHGFEIAATNENTDKIHKELKQCQSTLDMTKAQLDASEKLCSRYELQLVQRKQVIDDLTINCFEKNSELEMLRATIDELKLEVEKSEKKSTVDQSELDRNLNMIKESNEKQLNRDTKIIEVTENVSGLRCHLSEMTLKYNVSASKSKDDKNKIHQTNKKKSKKVVLTDPQQLNSIASRTRSSDKNIHQTFETRNQNI